jgi:hypothetical protein
MLRCCARLRGSGSLLTCTQLRLLRLLLRLLLPR